MIGNRDPRQNQFTAPTLESEIRAFIDKLKIAVSWLFWLDAIGMVTVPIGTDIRMVLGTIKHYIYHYRSASETADSGKAASSAIIPHRVVNDTSRYDDMPSAVLRPGVIFSSPFSNVDVEPGSRSEL